MTAFSHFSSVSYGSDDFSDSDNGSSGYSEDPAYQPHQIFHDTSKIQFQKDSSSGSVKQVGKQAGRNFNFSENYNYSQQKQNFQRSVLQKSILASASTKTRATKISRVSKFSSKQSQKSTTTKVSQANTATSKISKKSTESNILSYLKTEARVSNSNSENHDNSSISFIYKPPLAVSMNYWDPEDRQIWKELYETSPVMRNSKNLEFSRDNNTNNNNITIRPKNVNRGH